MRSRPSEQRCAKNQSSGNQTSTKPSTCKQTLQHTAWELYSYKREKDQPPTNQHPIIYYLATFTPTKQNYSIYEREFLGVKKALEHWQPYLIWTREPFVIETDYENLTYWKMLKKLTGQMARWHEKLQDYNFKIVHIAGKTNTPADTLLWPNSEDIQKEEKEVALILPEAFIQIFDTDLEGSLESNIVYSQRAHQSVMEKWEEDLQIQ